MSIFALRKPAESHSELAGMADPGAKAQPTLFGEFIAEILGSMMIALFGFGVVAQVTVGAGALGGHDSIAWSWGLGVTFGIFVAGTISGAHLNPAVTLAVALYKGFPWSKVGPYIVAQVIGFFLGALAIYLNYMYSLKAIDPGKTLKTQGVFSTLPGNGTNAYDVHIPQALLDQVLGTAVLVFLIFAITDALGANPTPAVSAIAVGLIVVGIGFALGLNDGYAINPARDFGPRLMEWIVGYKDAWLDQRGTVFFWVPIVGPIIGAIVGGGVYQATIARTLPMTLAKKA
ncbi:MIP/aquaporin family protein [Frondihabitans australicus]|uniref:Glycerol uptake facilitator protein n=1 Tax=Frondihabitans australicus TaxID=386892 RepID=A0A495IJ65_9MICO|nr:MIP/aquaporin family protein [Frondihabitans australicus]RKR75156.1 glycerol uptake facilitator protein [Frondihabitans australicus]